MSGLLALALVSRMTFNPAIKVCQVGYLPSETKIGILTTFSSGFAFIHVAGQDKTVMKAPIGNSIKDPDTGDDIQQIDFSKLTKPGTYVVSIPGIGDSAPFKVGNDVFAHAFRLAIRSYYGQRSGIDVNLAPDFPQYHFKAGHTALAQYDPSSGKTGTRDVTGGWYDAGDYGRYVVNSGITTGTLLWAYEMNAKKLVKVKLNIPETGKSKRPDFLSEVKWNLDWMLKMQDTDGGAWHKATTANFSGFIAPDQDKAPVLVVGTGHGEFKNTTATADLAAVAAIAARVFKPYDSAYATKCLAAAKKGFAWAQAHPDELFTRNPKGISTGGYGDGDARDERLWAAAELFRTTGAAEYQKAFLELAKAWPDTITSGNPPGWPQVRPMALMTFAMTDPKIADKTYQTRVRVDLAKAAKEIVRRVKDNAYLMPLTAKEYYWGSNSVVANYALMLQVADHIAPRPEYKQAALDCLHYLFGRNTFATSFVTQVGTQSAMNPHHRPSRSLGLSKPFPGLLVGGPNADNGKTPPAKQWEDNWENYRVNEVAINWNAPLVFALANELP
ncbi:MAG: glycosyl hydrolase family 5 [Armatimonadetes bacterium]|nr:glycosyl hydrolase family 5 [Armatimonadota bacterium]